MAFSSLILTRQASASDIGTFLFSEHGLARVHWRNYSTELFDSPLVIVISPMKESDERTRVQQNDAFHLPNPFMCFLL